MKKYRVLETRGLFYVEVYEQVTLFLIPIGRRWFKTDESGNASWHSHKVYDNIEEAKSEATKFGTPDKIHELN